MILPSGGPHDHNDRATLLKKLRNITQAKKIARNNKIGHVPIVNHAIVGKDGEAAAAFISGISFDVVKREVAKDPRKASSFIKNHPALNTLMSMIEKEEK